MTAPKSNRSAVLVAPHTIEIQDRPLPPAPGPGQVQINVVASGICGSDLHRWHLGNAAFEGKPATVDAPTVMGHESAGLVVQVGEGVNHVQVGDKVVIEPCSPCFRCSFCIAGKHNLCRSGVNHSMLGHAEGFLVQYVTVNAHQAIKLPAEMTWDEAACLQPLAIAVHTARRAGFKSHQSVAVIGAGPVGLFIMAVAKAYGAKTVIAVDVSPQRLEVAKRFVATHAVPSVSPKEGEAPLAAAIAQAAEILKETGAPVDGVDVAVDAAGVEPTMRLGVALVKPGGVYMQVGLGARESSFPTRLVAVKELDVRGVIRYSQGSFHDALDLLARGLVDVKPFISRRVPLTETQSVIEELRKAEVVKVVIYNNEVDGSSL